MDALLRQSPTAAYIASRLGDDLFTVIDVGCSGGHMPGWRALGPHFRAVGFDPQRYEIARLRESETNPLVEYVEAYVAAPADHPLRKLHEYDVYWSRSCWSRLAPARTLAFLTGAPVPEFTAFDNLSDEAPIPDLPVEGYPRPLQRRSLRPVGGASAVEKETSLDVNADDADRQLNLQKANRWYEADLADESRQIFLPDFLAERSISDIDFLKIDVDGPDYEILYTMSERITDCQVLGASLEVNYNGSYLPHHHTFHNVDRFMKAHGFALFDLTVRKYSSAALPQPYEMLHAAQSIRGRPLQGDALYIRDFGLKIPESDAEQVSDEKLAKTAILFAIFNLPSEAVEHMMRFRDRLSHLFDVDEAIELITQESQREEWTWWTYKEYVAAFEEQNGFFFNRQKAPEWHPDKQQGTHPTTVAQEVGREAQARAEAAEAEVAALREELNAMQKSLAEQPLPRRGVFGGLFRR